MEKKHIDFEKFKEIGGFNLMKEEFLVRTVLQHSVGNGSECETLLNPSTSIVGI